MKKYLIIVALIALIFGNKITNTSKNILFNKESSINTYEGNNGFKVSTNVDDIVNKINGFGDLSATKAAYDKIKFK